MHLNVRNSTSPLTNSTEPNIAYGATLRKPQKKSLVYRL